MAADSRQKAMEAVQAIFDRYHLIESATNYNGFDKRLMAEARLLDASVGPPHAGVLSQTGSAAAASIGAGIGQPAILSSATFAVPISSAYGNINGVMHGAAAAVIYDMLTTCALGPLGRPGYWDFLGGVTRSLNISCLRPVEIGTTVHVHSHVHQIGRTMAFIRGFMTSEDGSIVYTTCEHHKVYVPTRQPISDFPIPWDDQWKTVATKGEEKEEKDKAKL